MSKKQVKKDNKITLGKDKFLQNVIHDNILSCNNITHKDFDVEKSRRKSTMNLTALNVNGGLQTLLASQMLAVHQLQQTAMTMVNGLSYSDESHYYTNTAIKLSNTFIQQCSLLAKLQGGSVKKSLLNELK